MDLDRWALVRGIPDCYDRVTRGASPGDGEGPMPVDVGLARRQHAAYVEALGALGLPVRAVPTDHEGPDSCFVEDTVVVVGGRALACRTGHPDRRREGPAVVRALTELGVAVTEMRDGALEGGDVLRVGRRLLVGRSARTDEAGVAALRDRFADLDVIGVDLPPGVLHLKCVCSAPAPDLVVLAEESLDRRLFAGARVVTIPAEEAYAANTVGRAGRVIVAAGYPVTARRLSGLGLQVVPLEVSEIRRGDGSLTCLSVIRDGG